MTDEWDPDWIEPRPGFLSMPDSAKDEFHERVGQYLQRELDWGHSGRTVLQHEDGTPIRVHEIIANTPSGTHRSRLWIADAQGGLVTWTAGTGPRDENELLFWEKATADAVSRLGERTRFEWHAYLA